MKRLSMSFAVVGVVLATHVWAGSLTINGSLTVATNLTAQSITLGGVTQTNLNWLPLQGYKYVTVAEGTNDLQRGGNLQAAYATATTLNPSCSNRVAVIVPPGAYNLGSTNLVMNTSYVDLIGLVPAQMTSKQVFTNSAGRQSAETVANVQCPVLIYASASAGTLSQSVDNVRIESLTVTNTGSGGAYCWSVGVPNTTLRHVSMSSIRTTFSAGGKYIDCVCVGSAFPGADGNYIDCVGGDNSFGGDNGGVFIDCTGGDYSFSGGEGDASGTYRGCVGGTDSFGGGSGTASGTFIDCVGGPSSFAGYDGGFSQDGGTASGTFINCVGGDNSFASNGDSSGTFTSCTGGGSSFGSLDNSTKLQHCQGGGGSFGGYEASQDFNYNVGGTNTFLMLPQLPTPSTTNGLPSGTVYNSSGTLKIMP